ncbi:phage tail-collar fiber domain-containing protein [Shewanella surugensis]|uniref:Phage tail protein n=1 Tax=Shewanella surugensis TaxID=212020 RepID=A0ABT0L7F6_9GAMM|nr:phage tail protein [Shewanella surugensis]MCL1123297.1 phage tail protein [Shewanella surugensis]
MSQLTITNAGIDYKNAVFAGDEVQNITHFVFAYIPNLDADLPIDPDSTIDNSHIVASHPVERVSKLNGNAVLMSAVLDYSVGDFTYNAYGVVATQANSDEVLIAIVHTSEQTKTKTVGAVTGNYSVKSIVWRGASVAGELGITLSTLPWQTSDSEFLRSEDFAAHLSHANPHSQYVLNSEVAVIVKGTITNSTRLWDEDIQNPALEVGHYHQDASVSAKLELNYPIELAGSLTVTLSSGSGVTYTYKVYHDGETYVCGVYNGTWTPWARQYDTSNPPTAAEVGALSEDGTSVNSSQLAGLLPTSLATNNSIAKRDASGNTFFTKVTSQSFYEDGKNIRSVFLNNETTDQTFTGKLIASSPTAKAGVYGDYSIESVSLIFSMGAAYQLGLTGKDFGNLYGLARAYGNKINDGDGTNSGLMGGGHQAVWCQNGKPTSAMGNDLWTQGYVYEHGKQLREIYLTVDGKSANAELLQGLKPNYGAVATTIAARDSNGSLQAKAFHENGNSLASKYLQISSCSKEAISNKVVIRDAYGGLAVNQVNCANMSLSRSPESKAGGTIEAGYVLFCAQNSNVVQRIYVAELFEQLLTHVSSSSGGTGGTNPPDVCFEVGTQVLLENGASVAIEMLRVGDKVKSIYHPILATGNDTEWKTVKSDDVEEVEIKSATVRSLILGSDPAHYILNDDVKVTYEHPFLVLSQAFNDWRWIAISNIKVGDKIYSLDNDPVLVESLEYVEERINTVNLDVEELDNYFVNLSGEWILAHNSDTAKP